MESIEAGEYRVEVRKGKKNVVNVKVLHQHPEQKNRKLVYQMDLNPTAKIDY